MSFDAYIFEIPAENISISNHIWRMLQDWHFEKMETYIFSNSSTSFRFCPLLWQLLIQPDSFLLQPLFQIAHFAVENLVVVIILQLTDVTG